MVGVMGMVTSATRPRFRSHGTGEAAKLLQPHQVRPASAATTTQAAVAVAVAGPGASLWRACAWYPANPSSLSPLNYLSPIPTPLSL